MEAVNFPFEGGRASGELFAPKTPSAPALVLVHEWWGLNDDVRRMAGRFAEQGFLTLAIDLYHGRSTAEAEVAMQLSNELSTAVAMKEIAGAVAFLGSDARSNGKVGVTGFCLGGAISLASAFNVDGLSAVVPFYGNPRADFVHLEKKTAPIQGHYAKNDGFIDSGRTRAIAEGVRANGGAFELFMYDAGHAFMREADPHAYHAESATLAWERAFAFLHAELD